MKHCKKLAAIASALLVLGFTACSSDGDGGSGSGSDDSIQTGIPATGKPTETTPTTPTTDTTPTTGTKPGQTTPTTPASTATTPGTPTTARTPSASVLVKPTYKTVYGVTEDTYMKTLDEIIARLDAGDPSQPKEFEFLFTGSKPITWRQFYYSSSGIYNNGFTAKMNSIKNHYSDVRVGMDFSLAKVDDNFITSDRLFNDGPYKSVVLPKKVSSGLTLCNHYFDGCKYLEYIKFPENLSGFGGYTVYLSNSVSGVSLKCEIPAGVKTVSTNAFCDSRNLTTVIFNVGITDIGTEAFSNCKKLESVSLNNGLGTIGSKAFNNCEALKSIELPSSLKSIEANAFSCSGLKKIVIPENVTNLGEGIFNACQNLETVEIHTPEIGDNVLSNTNSIVIGEKVVKIGKNNFGDTALSSVVFKNPEGWKCDGVPVDSAILKDPADAATYLKTNKDKIFTRQ